LLPSKYTIARDGIVRNPDRGAEENIPKSAIPRFGGGNKVFEPTLGKRAKFARICDWTGGDINLINLN
jgi:hypothetical protein